MFKNQFFEVESKMKLHDKTSQMLMLISNFVLQN